MKKKLILMISMFYIRLSLSRIYTRVKKSDIFETLKHSQNYFIAQIITHGLAFISIPIFTRFFSQEDYGIVSVYNAYLSFIIILLSANAYASVSRYYFEKKQDFNEFLGTTLILTGGIFLVSTSLYLVFYDFIASSMKLPGFLPLLLILSSFIMVFNNIYFQIIQAQRRSLESAIVSILKGVLTLLLAIIFVLLLEKERYLGKIVATLIIGVVFASFFIYRILATTKFSFNKNHIKYILTYSIPLIPYALSSIILAFFDRIMINDAVGAASAGLYSLGYNIAMLIGIVIGATQTALLPDFFIFLNQKQYSRLDALVSKVFAIITFAALGLILFAQEIILVLVDTKFHESISVIPIIIIGYVFFGMFTVYSRYIIFTKQTIYSSLIMILSGLVNIVLNAILIPQYGYIAAAYTTAISYFFLFLLSWIIPKFVLRQITTPLWKIWKSAVLLFIYLVIYNVITLNPMNIILLITVKLIILALFFVQVFNQELKKILLSMKIKEAKN
jgi:O-antigen/teichoic acid export membrane protein